MDLDELRRRRLELQSRSNKTLYNMQKIIDESRRVAEVARDSRQILDNLDLEFEKKTGLTGLDVKFLFFATALQCTRQYLLSNDKFRFEKASDADKLISKPIRDALNKTGVKKDYKDIILGGVPYDIIPSKHWGTGLSGLNHREMTLGHDPVLGWVFGTMNIMTGSLTKKDLLLSSYSVKGNDIESITSFPSIALSSIDIAKEDYKLLVASVVKQGIHYASDAFTAKGLPLPILNNISSGFSSTLIKNNIDMYSVTRGAAVSVLINTIIAAVHGLYYDERVYLNRDVYEVKTRKILSYSNAIASVSNVILVAIMGTVAAQTGNAKLGKKAWSYLDIGGLMVTIYRLINDREFIRKVKEEFVFGEFDNLIKGTDYDF